MVVLFVHWFRIEAIAFVESQKMANFLLWYLDVVSRACFSALSSAVRMDMSWWSLTFVVECSKTIE